jgi:hypothetical protein
MLEGLPPETYQDGSLYHPNGRATLTFFNVYLNMLHQHQQRLQRQAEEEQAQA